MSQLLVTTHPLNITHSPNMSRMASISSCKHWMFTFSTLLCWEVLYYIWECKAKYSIQCQFLKIGTLEINQPGILIFFVQSVLNSTLKTSAGCYYYYYYISIMLQWSRKCLPFRSIWVHTRFCMGFMLLELQFHGYFV